jgi:hypothetical protein
METEGCSWVCSSVITILSSWILRDFLTFLFFFFLCFFTILEDSYDENL